MQIIDQVIKREELKELAQELFGEMIKAVVDVDRELVAVNAELHADLESFLLKEGSSQDNLWGINLYPELTGEEFVEFDSMINVRPSQGNSSRGVDDPKLRERIINIVNKRVSL